MSQPNVINLNKLLETFSENDMVTICEPLTLLGIHHFHFLKIFNDNSRISICNNKGWLEYFYQNELFKQAYFFKENKYQSGATIWNHINEKSSILTARELYKITNNGLTVVMNKLDSCNLYHFASKRKERIELFSNNNFELSHRFIYHFHEKAHLIIKNAIKVKLVGNDEPKQNNFLHLTKDIELFKQRTKCNKFFVEEHECYLTKQEINIIRQYINGSSCQIIAENNFLSPYTIQTHINNVKSKLHCKKTSELIRLLKQVSFI